MQTSRVSALIPLSLSEAHLIVLMGNFTGNALLRLISSDRLVGGGTETSRHFFSSSFVSSSKGTPLGEPSEFSHDISGGSFNCGVSSARRLLCKSITMRIDFPSANAPAGVGSSFDQIREFR